MKEKDKELAENLLCSKRLDMDDALCKLAEIQFFFSSVTGVTRNKKRKRSTECEELNEGKDAELEQQDSNSLINETSETEKSSQSSSHADSSEAVLEEPDFYPAIAYFVAFTETQAFHGLAPKCKLINMHELINISTNDHVTLLPCENGANVNNKG